MLPSLHRLPLRSEARAAALLATAHFTISAVTISLTRFEGGVALVWLASAVIVAHLSSRPARAWPLPLAACALSSAVATSLFGVGPAAAPALALVNIAEAALVVALLRRLGVRSGYFDSLNNVLLFAGVAGAAAALTALPGAGLVAWATGTPFTSNAINWFTGHLLGTFVLSPFATLIYAGEIRSWVRSVDRTRAAEAAALIGLVAAAVFATFWQRGLPLLFLPMLPMLIAAFRLGRFGASTSLLLLTMISAVLTVEGRGPISLLDVPIGLKTHFYQFYLAVSVMTLLPAAAHLRERKSLLDRLQESEARLRAILEHSGDAIFSIGTSGTIRFVSPAAGALFGCAPDDLVGRNAFDLVLAEDRPQVDAVMRQAFAAPERTFIAEFRSLLPNGDIVWHESHSRALCDGSGRAVAFVSSVRDISSRKAREARLSAAASSDPLTGLLNRRGFEAALDATVGAQSARGCIALLDLDHFKSVNDRYGHAAGDAVLRRIGELGRASLRNGDLMARVGGEEFVLLLREVQVPAAEAICERFRARIGAEAFLLDDGTSIRVTASIGIAELGPNDATAAVLKRADDALYCAKAAGRNRLMRAAA